MTLRRKELAKLRIRLQKVALELEAIEAEVDRAHDAIGIPLPVMLELEYIVRDLQTANGRREV